MKKYKLSKLVSKQKFKLNTSQDLQESHPNDEIYSEYIDSSFLVRFRCIGIDNNQESFILYLFITIIVFIFAVTLTYSLLTRSTGCFADLRPSQVIVTNIFPAEEAWEWDSDTDNDPQEKHNYRCLAEIALIFAPIFKTNIVIATIATAFGSWLAWWTIKGAHSALWFA